MAAIKTTQVITVQQVAKVLNKSGLKKAKTERINFQDVQTGHFEARHLKSYGLNTINVLPKNGTTCNQVESILNNQGIKTQVVKGYVVIL